MKIDDTNRPRVVSGATRSPSKRDKVGSGPRTVVDNLSIMGIPANELTPKVRDAIMTLMAEVDRMRGRSRNNAPASPISSALQIRIR